MKRLISITLIILVGLFATANTFYIAPTGSDAAPGDLTHPFATLKKAWSVVAAGDIIYLRGGTYTFSTQQSLTGKNGTALNPIKVWAYPSESPVLALNSVSKGITLTGNYINFKGIEINGLATLTGWTNAGNGIYSKSVACETPTNMVVINGVNTAMGRYPNADAANSGYLTVDAPNSSNTITDAALPLPSVIDWTGAELVARRDHFTMDRDIVTAHNSHTLTYSPYTGGQLRGIGQGFGYFLQNSLNALDQTGEWYYNGTVLYMVNPGTSVVKTSTVSDLFYAPNCNYLTFTDCKFTGGNQSNFRIINSKYVNITGCTFDYAGKNALEVWVGGSSDSLTVRNSIFINANNCAILLRENTTKVLIERNTITNTGIFPGMASKTNIDGSHEAIYQYKSSGISVLNNNITNTGYCAIALHEDQCTGTLIKNNFIDTFCTLKDDGGGIYSYRDQPGTDAERTIEGNIILNGIGANNGTPGDVNPNASGIYLDGYVNHVTIINNTAANNAYCGVLLHNSLNVNVHDNTFYSNAESGLVLTHDRYGPEIRNANITRNIAFVKGNNFLNQLQKLVTYNTSSDDFTLFGTLDSNYYCAPLTSVPENALIFKTENSLTQGVSQTFAGWKSLLEKDANSILSAATLSGASSIRFEYNNTASEKTVALTGIYIDAKGDQYINSITLLPYTSAVLMLSSVIVNQSPVIQNQAFQLSENSPNATVAGTVAAYDPNAGQLLTFSILSGNTNGAFAINPTSGVITVANFAALDYETTTTLQLTVNVADNGDPVGNSTAVITISLIDVNENTLNDVTWPLLSYKTAVSTSVNLMAESMITGSGVTRVQFNGSYLSVRPFNATTLNRAIKYKQYCQFKVYPKSGYHLQVSNISFYRALSGGSATIVVLGSSSPYFTSSTTLGTVAITNISLVQSTWPVNINVSSGSAYYIRVYAYKTSSTVYLRLKNFSISTGLTAD